MKRRCYLKTNDKIGNYLNVGDPMTKKSDEYHLIKDLIKEIKKQNEINSKLSIVMTWMTGVILFFTVLQVVQGLISLLIEGCNLMTKVVIYIIVVFLVVLFYCLFIIPRLKMDLS